MTSHLQVPTEAAHYFTSGWLSISLPNLIMIGILVALFVLALVVPFPRDDHDARDDS